MKYVEYNCDGLIGPNHNYCGLSYGNVASLANKNAVANPKQAAQQGLAKMRKIMALGGKQLVLPPHERPAIGLLRELGFSGSDTEVLETVAKQDPQLLANVSSASAMWAANSATVTPSSDSADGKVHFTAANLNQKFHRSIEAEQSRRILQATFNDPTHFCHHSVLPQSELFGDEGAANHARFCNNHGDTAVQLLVYGRNGLDTSQPAPQKYPARHTLQASQAIVRAHQIAPQRVIYAQQNPAIIDQGIFHNDVIAMGNRNVYIYHQDAYLYSKQLLAQIHGHFAPGEFYAIEVPRDEVSIEDALASYFFNSQLIDLADGVMALVVPVECESNAKIQAYLSCLVALDNPIKEIVYMDLTQSMNNGGGPACLRLRVVLNEIEAQAINQGSILTETLYQDLSDWIERHYRSELLPSDLADPVFLGEVRRALLEVNDILQLPALYSF